MKWNNRLFEQSSPQVRRLLKQVSKLVKEEAVAFLHTKDGVDCGLEVIYAERMDMAVDYLQNISVD